MRAHDEWVLFKELRKLILVYFILSLYFMATFAFYIGSCRLYCLLPSALTCFSYSFVHNQCFHLKTQLIWYFWPHVWLSAFWYFWPYTWISAYYTNTKWNTSKNILSDYVMFTNKTQMYFNILINSKRNPHRNTHRHREYIK